MLHETENWVILTDCSNAFNTVNRMAALAEVATCLPVLAPFATKRYSGRLTNVFFQVDSGEHRAITCSSRVQQGGGYGTSDVLLVVAAWTELLPCGVRGGNS